MTQAAAVATLSRNRPAFRRGREATHCVLACGAIAREVLAVIRLNSWTHVTLECLPAKLHLTPEGIPGAVDAKLHELSARFDRIFVAYADCGTAGALDRVLDKHGVERLPGAHCYGFFAGNSAWLEMHEAEPGTFYLTDFLVRHFDALVIRSLGLDRHPELIVDVFGNYRRLVYLAQSDEPELVDRAREAAAQLGLDFEHYPTGLGALEPSLVQFVEAERAA